MLRFDDLIRISSAQVLRQRGRYLGVVSAIALGTAGFIVIATMGRDVKQTINRDLDLLGGVTMIKVEFDVFKPFVSRFTDETVDAIRGIPGVTGVSSLVRKVGVGTAVMPGQDRKHHFPVVGIDHEFWESNSFEAERGGFFTAEAVERRETVCVMGDALAQRVYGGRDPVGQLLPVDDNLYRVVGTLAGPGVGDRDGFVFLPITTAQDRIASLTPRNRLYVRCATWDDVEPVSKALPATVGRHQSAEDLTVLVRWKSLVHVRRIGYWVELFSYVSVVATLVLGGYGIWNGMMSAVKARTREIGLKKAMGAEERDILKQFLTESLCLSMGSAVVGMLIGRLAIMGIGVMLGSPAPEGLFAICVTLSLVVSVVLGVGAGFYPSVRASRMEVVSAIRYE